MLDERRTLIKGDRAVGPTPPSEATRAPGEWWKTARVTGDKHGRPNPRVYNWPFQRWFSSESADTAPRKWFNGSRPDGTSSGCQFEFEHKLVKKKRKKKERNEEVKDRRRLFVSGLSR